MFREDYKKGTVPEYGFRREGDLGFPIRGKAAYRQVRRRKWLDTEDGTIFTYNFELNEKGSKLTPEFVAFLNREIESKAESISSIDSHYVVHGSFLSRQYREKFSDYRYWDQLEHAQQYILYPNNMGPNLAIDETCPSCGEIYTIVTNRDAHGKKGSLIAVL